MTPALFSLDKALFLEQILPPPNYRSANLAFALDSSFGLSRKWWLSSPRG